MAMRVILVMLSYFVLGGAGAAQSSSFSQMKQAVYDAYPVTDTFYCDCQFSDRKVSLASCGVPHTNSRALRTEVEHVVPASVLGRGRECWARGGRDECEASDPEYRRMANDPMNLRITVGSVNAARSNYAFGDIPGEQTRFGACDFEVDTQTNVAEPPDSVKGDVARVYQYMAAKYGLTLPKWQMVTFQHWSQMDPLTTDERELVARLQQISVSRLLTPAPNSGINNVTAGCDSEKRYCRQMNSCAEAHHYLKQCGLSNLDRDKDGTPCEALCRQ